MVFNKPYGRHWFHCNPVLPTVFEDSLSYYELLCKIHRWLIEVSEYLENNDFITRPELEIELGKLRDELNNRIDNLGDELLNKIRPELESLQDQLDNLADIVARNKAELESQINDLKNNINTFMAYVIQLINDLEEWVNQQVQLYAFTFNPYTGIWDSVVHILHRVVQSIRVNGLTAQEYDELELTAAEYEAKNWTAYEYAWQSVAHYKEV